MAECDEMMNYQRRVLDSMQSIKEVIIAQQHALAEQRNYNYNNKPLSEADEDGSSFNDKTEGSGGGLLLPDAVTAAVDPKHPNGGAVLTVHERCATLADYVSTNPLSSIRNPNLATRLCQVDSQDGLQAFSDRLKSPTKGDEPGVTLIPRSSISALPPRLPHPTPIYTDHNRT
ncbi:MAG: hypothetical protein Q9223_003557 [Gallowayella weberi]